MRLRRLFAGLAGALALATVPMAPAAAEVGPACADIINGSGSYGSFDGQAFVSANAETVAPACAQVTYAVNVHDTAGALITSAPAIVVDGSSLTFFVNVPGSPTEVCVTLTSSIGRRVFDTAPDAPEAGCATGSHMTLGGGSGAGSWH